MEGILISGCFSVIPFFHLIHSTYPFSKFLFIDGRQSINLELASDQIQRSHQSKSTSLETKISKLSSISNLQGYIAIGQQGQIINSQGQL